MKKIFFYVLTALLLLQLTGCETVQRKFTRKKEKPKHVASAIFFEEGDYQKKFSNDYYYKTHYTLWRTWHDDLLDNLTGNEKKMNRAAEESIGNLQQMQQYLNPEKSAELGVILNDLKDVIGRIRAGSGSRSSQTGPFRTELERIRRAVGNDFYYDKIKDSLLADKVDLGDQTAPDAKAPESNTPATA